MPLRLAELLVGLSRRRSRHGAGAGGLARGCLIATRLADALGVAEAADVYYTTLLQHVGCTAYAHEGAALLGGDEIAAKAAALAAIWSSARARSSTATAAPTARSPPGSPGASGSAPAWSAG